MAKTVAQLLKELEKPENEDKIKNLAHLKNLKSVENIKNIPVVGVIAGAALRLANKHMDAIMVLAECKSAADIAAFKQTEHYKKVKKVTINANLEDLEHLEELEALDDLNDLL